MRFFGKSHRWRLGFILSVLLAYNIPANAGRRTAGEAACYDLLVKKVDAFQEDPLMPLVEMARSTKSILAKHFSDLKAYKKKYELALKESQAQPESNEFQQRAYKSKITEANGEIAAATYMKDFDEYEMISGFAPGTGYDQVYIRRGETGLIEEILIVEAKGPGAHLSTDAAKGMQMSKTWIRHTAEELAKATQPKTMRDLGNIITKALAGGPPALRGKVLQADDAGNAVELTCPNRCRYN